MDRMTQRDINGIPFCQNAGYLDMLQRLAAYEDTGMMPSEAQFVQEEYIRFRKLEDEGRLIILPSDPCEMADVAQEILSRACKLQREAEAALGGVSGGV